MFQALLDIVCDKDKTVNDFSKLLNTTSANIFNETDKEYGASLIHWASLYNRNDFLVAIKNFLIKKKISAPERKKLFSKKDDYGRTPLHWCVDENALDCCQYFLDEHPSLAFIPDKKQQTVLHYAAKENRCELVEKLCDYDEQNNNDDESDWLVLARDNNDKQAINLSTDDKIKLRLQTSSLRDHPLRPIIGRHLTTHRNYMVESPIQSDRLQESELYCRSHKHPMVRKLGKKAELRYKKSSELKNGMKAHVGSYGNILQMLGDNFTQTEETPLHHPSDSLLYNDILNYKNSLCTRIVKTFSESRSGSAITVGHHNNYPCVMVNINRKTIHKADDIKDPSVAAFESWIDFLLSYFTGLMNYAAYKAGLPIEIGRRGSFGFITPTVSPAGASFRISMGIVPLVYADMISNILVQIDDILTSLSNDELDVAELPKKTFYNSKKHKLYLNEKYPAVELEDAMQLLWAQVEKNGQTTVQNITRSAFARDGVACAAFTHCYEQEKLAPESALSHALLWAIGHIDVSSNKLSFKTQDDLEYPVRIEDTSYVCNDTQFWNLIHEIHGRIATLEDETISACLAKLAACIAKKEISGLYAAFDQINEAVFMLAIKTNDDEDYGDGYGSDSDEEGEINGSNIFAKKIITHSGMRAIWGAITACSTKLGNIRIYLQEAYYETPLGIHLIQKLEKLNSITIVKRIAEANVIMYDINACMTVGKNTQRPLTIETLKQKGKYVILDATSATSQQIHDFLPLLASEKNRVQLLLVVESGLKNQQVGFDKNPHGVVRVFSKSAENRDELYEIIKKTESPVKSATSHRHRHYMKMFGATSSNKAILTGTPQKLKSGSKAKTKPH